MSTSVPNPDTRPALRTAPWPALDQTSLTESLVYSEAGTQTELSVANTVSCATYCKLLSGVVLSAVGLVTVIFIMKCKFKIGFQMNMCYYM